MRKRIISHDPELRAQTSDSWFDLGQCAQIEVTSEDPQYPIEYALLPGEGPGWQAEVPGEQTIRVVFDQPQTVRRIRLEFSEPSVVRTQELVLRWAPTEGTPQELFRQQWNFSPQGSNHELEDYRVDLPEVGLLELTLIPDKAGGETRASLAQMRIA